MRESNILERSKSADDMINDRYTVHPCRGTSHTSTTHSLLHPPPAHRGWSSPSSPTSSSPHTPPLSSHAAIKNKYSSSDHSLIQMYQQLPPSSNLPSQLMYKGGHDSDTGSIIGSSEAMSFGCSDSEAQDDLSDTESENEWEDCEITQV